jgi:hypothetical protein
MTEKGGITSANRSTGTPAGNRAFEWINKEER